jgi:hypothetical protein
VKNQIPSILLGFFAIAKSISASGGSPLKLLISFSFY